MTAIVPAKFNKANLRKDEQTRNSGRHTDKQNRKTAANTAEQTDWRMKQKSILYNNVQSRKVLK